MGGFYCSSLPFQPLKSPLVRLGGRDPDRVRRATDRSPIWQKEAEPGDPFVLRSGNQMISRNPPLEQILANKDTLENVSAVGKQTKSATLTSVLRNCTCCKPKFAPRPAFSLPTTGIEVLQSLNPPGASVPGTSPWFSPDEGDSLEYDVCDGGRLPLNK